MKILSVNFLFLFFALIAAMVTADSTGATTGEAATGTGDADSTGTGNDDATLGSGAKTTKA